MSFAKKRKVATVCKVFNLHTLLEAVQVQGWERCSSVKSERNTQTGNLMWCTGENNFVWQKCPVSYLLAMAMALGQYRFHAISASFSGV